MYSNAALAMPKSSLTSADERDAARGRAQHAVVRRRDEHDGRRVVDDRLDRDDALEAPVGETNATGRGRDAKRDRPAIAVVAAAIESVPTLSDDAVAVAASAQRERLPTSVRMSLGSSTVVGRWPLYAGGTTSATSGVNRFALAPAATLGRVERIAGVRGARMRATAPAGKRADDDRSRPRARATGARSDAHGAPHAPWPSTVGAGDGQRMRSSPVSTAVTSVILERLESAPRSTARRVRATARARSRQHSAAATAIAGTATSRRARACPRRRA